MFFKSKKSERKPSQIVGLTSNRAEVLRGARPTPGQKVPPTPPPLFAPLSPDLIDVDFASPPTAIANSPFDVKGGELLLGAGQFWKGEPTMKASNGEAFEIKTRARLVRPPANGATNGFYVGPLIYDADGEVLTWWESVPQVTAAEGFREIAVCAVAPAGAASVGIGICGTWSGDDKPADFVVSFRRVKLKRLDT